MTKNDSVVGQVVTAEGLKTALSLIEKQGCKYHHTATAQGYVSRKLTAEILVYCGRYGRGYTVHYPSYAGTKYHTVAYYVQPVHSAK